MKKTPYPSETQERFIIRLPDGMRDRIAEEAKKNGRSMNAEIVHVLTLVYNNKQALNEMSFADAPNNALGDEIHHAATAAITAAVRSVMEKHGLGSLWEQAKRPFSIDGKSVANASLMKITLKPDNFPDLSTDFIDFVKYCFHDLRTDHITVECKEGVPHWLGKALTHFAGYGYPMAIVGPDVPEEIKAALKVVTGSQAPQYSWDEVTTAEQNTLSSKKPE